jgi:cell division protein FtsX
VSPPHEADLPAAAFDLASFERLVRVETKLDASLHTKAADHAAIIDDLRDHEHRIRGLERVWWKTAGIAAGISALIASGTFAVYINTIGVQ